jgi:hypothetical protein
MAKHKRDSYNESYKPVRKKTNKQTDKWYMKRRKNTSIPKTPDHPETKEIQAALTADSVPSALS